MFKQLQELRERTKYVRNRIGEIGAELDDEMRQQKVPNYARPWNFNTPTVMPHTYKFAGALWEHTPGDAPRYHGYDHLKNKETSGQLSDHIWGVLKGAAGGIHALECDDDVLKQLHFMHQFTTSREMREKWASCIHANPGIKELGYMSKDELVDAVRSGGDDDAPLRYALGAWRCMAYDNIRHLMGQFEANDDTKKDVTDNFVRKFIDINMYSIKLLLDAGFVIAGGAVSDLLHNKDPNDRLTWNDVDVFAPGMEPAEAERKFISIMHELNAAAVMVSLTKQLPWEEPSKMYRTYNCITMVISTHDLEIQLITRKYDNISEIIYSFDIAPSCCAWDGRHVYMTPEAAFAHQVGVMWPDITKRRKTFEWRIVKYNITKGFAFVLPNLDTEKLDDTDTVRLPHFPVINVIRSSKYKTGGSCEMLMLDQYAQCDYQESLVGVYGSIQYFDNDSIMVHNVSTVLSGKPCLIWKFDGSEWGIESMGVHRVAKIIIRKLEECTSPRIHAKRVESVFGDNHAAVIEYMKQMAASAELGGIVLDQICATAERVHKYMQTVADATVKWKNTHDGTTLGEADHTQIFKLMPLSEDEWYGEWYKPL